MIPQWHVVRSSTGADKAVREVMRRIGIEIYYPCLRILKPTPRKFLSHKQRKSIIPIMRTRDEPLFPCYVFIKFDLKDGRWHEVFSVLGLHGLICRGGLPAELPGGTIEKLKALEVGGIIMGNIPLREMPFRLGEAVKVVDGPFTGLDATVDQIDREGRIAVLLELLGRKTRITNLTALDLQTRTREQPPRMAAQ